MSTTTPDLAKLHAEINQHPYVKLLRSKDPMMWYSSRVGEMIRVIGVNLDGYWAREGNEYNAINVIRFSDCEWVPHPLSHITPPVPDAPQGNDPAWTLASKVREALYRKACPGYYIDVAVEAVVHNYIYAPAAPSQERCCTCGYLTSEREHLGCLRKAVKDLDAATGGPYPSQEPVNRPQNCGTSYCSCIECVCEPSQPVTLTDEEIDKVALEATGYDGFGTQPMNSHDLRNVVHGAIAALREKEQTK